MAGSTRDFSLSLSLSFPELCKSHTGRHRWSAGRRFPKHLGADCNSLQSKPTALVIRMWGLGSVFASTATTILTLTKKKIKDLKCTFIVGGNVLPKKRQQIGCLLGDTTTTPPLFHFHACLYQVFSNRQPALCISLSGGRSLLVAPVLSPRPSYPDTPLLPYSFPLPASPCDDYAALCPSVDPHQRQ